MGKKLTTEEFIEKAKLVHGDKYDYSLVKYVKTKDKVKIICSKHGVFEQISKDHLKGHGCLKCSFELIRIKNSINVVEFVERAKKVHGDKYNYSSVNYINSHIKINIICPIHGIFNQKPHSHLNGAGCLKCGIKNSINSHVYKNNEFIKKAKSIHGNKYDYSLVDYKKHNIKIKIICSIHDVFEQIPYYHLAGNGCPKCANKNVTTEEFIEKAKLVHGNKYNYSKVEYFNSNTKINIICPIHGDFKQKPNNHLAGNGCIECSGINKLISENFIIKAKLIHDDLYNYQLINYINHHTKINIVCSKHGSFKQTPNNHLKGAGCPKCKGNIKSTEEFIEKSKLIHNNYYDYSKTIYVDSITKVIIDCLIHGEFKQIPYSHLRGNGCPICNSSKGELHVKMYLEKHRIEYIKEKCFDDCKNIKSLPFDFYIPKYNKLIEFDGEQHFKSVKYFGGDDGFKLRQTNDEIKNNYVKANNIDLLRIKYTEINNINEILTKYLL